MKTCICRLCLLFLVAGLCYWQCGAIALAGGLPEQDRPETFNAWITKVADRDKVVIIAEDGPFVASLSKAKSAEIAKRIVKKQVAIDAIKEIATAFDYVVIKQSKNVFLLKKRFSSEEDFPCVTLEEWKASITDVVRMVDPFSPDFGSTVSSDPRTKVFAQSLSPEQRNALKADAGLAVQEMTEEQNRFIRELCQNFFIEEPFLDLLRNYEEVNCFLDQNARIGWFQRFGSRLFGYEGRMSHRIRDKQFTDDHYFEILRPADLIPKRGIAENHQEKTESPRRSSDPDAVVTEWPHTLRQVVMMLNQSATKEPNSNQALPGFSIDPMLENKRVTIAGIQNAPVSIVFRGIANVYGLMVSTRGEGQQKVIGRNRQRPPSNLIELRASIRKALPEPFLRYTGLMHTSDTNSFSAQLMNRNQTAKWGNAALRRLRSTLEARLEGTKQENVFISSLLPSERIASANYFMARQVSAFLYFVAGEEIQPCLIAPETVVVTGGLLQDEKGKPVFSLMVNTRQPDGTLKPAACLQCLQVKELGFSP